MAKPRKPRHLEDSDVPGLEAAFGEVLRTHRRARGLTQGQLAVIVDTDRVYISQLERGVRRPSFAAVFRFARALELEPAQLVREVQERLAP